VEGTGVVQLKFPERCAMASSLGGPGVTSGVPSPRIVNLEFPPPPPYPPPHNQVTLEVRIVNFANDAHFVCLIVREANDSREKDLFPVYSHVFLS